MTSTTALRLSTSCARTAHLNLRFLPRRRRRRRVVGGQESAAGPSGTSFVADAGDGRTEGRDAAERDKECGGGGRKGSRGKQEGREFPGREWGGVPVLGLLPDHHRPVVRAGGQRLPELRVGPVDLLDDRAVLLQLVLLLPVPRLVLVPDDHRVVHRAGRQPVPCRGRARPQLIKRPWGGGGAGRRRRRRDSP